MAPTRRRRIGRGALFAPSPARRIVTATSCSGCASWRTGGGALRCRANCSWPGPAFWHPCLTHGTLDAKGVFMTGRWRRGFTVLVLLFGLLLLARPATDQYGGICGSSLGRLTHGSDWTHGGERDAATVASTNAACDRSAERHLVEGAALTMLAVLGLLLGARRRREPEIQLASPAWAALGQSR